VFDIVDDPSASPPTLYIAAIARHEARRAKDSKSTSAATTILQDESITAQKQLVLNKARMIAQLA